MVTKVSVRVYEIILKRIQRMMMMNDGADQVPLAVGDMDARALSPHGRAQNNFRRTRHAP